MKNEDPEDKAIAAYLSLLDREVSREEVARDKKAFIARHFRPKPVWMPALPVLVPAMAAALALIVFNFVMPQMKQAPQPAPVTAPVAAVQAPAVVEPAADKPVKLEIPDGMKKKRFFRIPRIWVKKVSSDVGQPMVYQKKAGDVPVTIIWVFTQPQPVNPKPVQPGIPT